MMFISSSSSSLFISVWIGKHGQVKDVASTGNQTPVGQLIVTKFLYLLTH